MDNKELRGKIAQKLFQFRFTISNKTIDAEWEFQSPKQPYLEEAAQILSICKEAGLKFVPDEWDFEGINLIGSGGLGITRHINSQIKEIDNE